MIYDSGIARMARMARKKYNIIKEVTWKFLKTIEKATKGNKIILTVSLAFFMVDFQTDWENWQIMQKSHYKHLPAKSAALTAEQHEPRHPVQLLLALKSVGPMSRFANEVQQLHHTIISNIFQKVNC